MIELPECKPGEHLLPEVAYITPSNINPWRGARRPDQVFTTSQLAVMRAAGIDPAGAEVLIVRSKATQRDMYWYSGDPTPVYLCPCPIIDRRNDGAHVQVISPAGMKKWVYADGSITRAGWGLKDNKKGGRRA